MNVGVGLRLSHARLSFAPIALEDKGADLPQGSTTALLDHRPPAMPPHLPTPISSDLDPSGSPTTKRNRTYQLSLNSNFSGVAASRCHQPRQTQGTRRPRATVRFWSGASPVASYRDRPPRKRADQDVRTGRCRHRSRSTETERDKTIAGRSQIRHHAGKFAPASALRRARGSGGCRARNSLLLLVERRSTTTPSASLQQRS